MCRGAPFLKPMSNKTSEEEHLGQYKLCTWRNFQFHLLYGLRDHVVDRAKISTSLLNPSSVQKELDAM